MSGVPTTTTPFFEKFALHADAARALRTAIAFGTPLFVCHALHHPVDAVFIALSAQTIAMQDLRGSYGVRFAIIVTMIIVAAAAAMLGVLSGASAVLAVLSMGLIAVTSGAWRHLSADYGPPMGVSSALLFLLGAARPGELHDAFHLAEQVLKGGAWAAALQMGFWLFRPQHPLRFAVAETWVAVSDLIAKMRADSSTSPDASNGLTAKENDLRAALDRTFAILGAAEKHRHSEFIVHLEEMRREVVHFSMRVTAFNNSLESLQQHPDYLLHQPVVDSVLKTLSDAARSVAVTLITHRPENFSSTELRLRRCSDLIRVLDDRLAVHSGDLAVMQTRAALGEIDRLLPRIAEQLAGTVDHGTARKVFPQMLPEIGARSVSSLAAWINPKPHIDPVLVRYSARMTAITMLAVALSKGLHVPRGYWVAFTIIVVLQPDYGSTRQRAAQRIGGTLAGVILGSALMWVPLPLFVVDALAMVTSFYFAWFVKQRYWIAIFFVTLLIVLITETTAPVTLELTISRLLCTLFGGGMALVAALVFWPVWEGGKFHTLLAAAVRANRTFLESIFPKFGLTPENPAIEPLMARRRAENANRYAMESLKRMTAEPTAHDDNTQRAAAVATYNQRITRALTAMAVHASEGITLRPNSVMPALVRDLEITLGDLAEAMGQDAPDSAFATLNAGLEKIEALIATIHITAPKETPGELSKAGLVWTQLAKCIAEIRAMTLALHPASFGPGGHKPGTITSPS